MLMPDVNVLIYSHRREPPDHARYAGWLVALATGIEPFALSELVCSGFVRIVTDPRAFEPPTARAAALAFVENLRSRPNCRPLRPGIDNWRIFARLCEQAGAHGKLIADAYHAALAIEHGCEWVTADADYARFEGLRWRHPLGAVQAIAARLPQRGARSCAPVSASPTPEAPCARLDAARPAGRASGLPRAMRNDLVHLVDEVEVEVLARLLRDVLEVASRCASAG